MTARMAYTVQETAASLGISCDLVYDLIARGELKSVKAGRRRLVRAESLELWVERNTESPNGQDDA